MPRWRGGRLLGDDSRKIASQQRPASIQTAPTDEIQFARARPPMRALDLDEAEGPPSNPWTAGSPQQSHLWPLRMLVKTGLPLLIWEIPSHSRAG